MSKLRITVRMETASEYAGEAGIVVAMKAKRQIWRKGSVERAMAFQLLFGHGKQAGNPLWFMRREVVI